MTYQVRITDADGSNTIILDKADSINYSKTINSANESISFEVPTSDPKSALIDNTKLWELWDIKANERLNRGPIHPIQDGDSGTLRISGPGRSQFLADHIQQDKTVFYNSVYNLLNSLRYENIAISPSTKTYVWDGKSDNKDVFFPPSVSIDETQYLEFYGLSKKTKDNAIDDYDGYILPGTEAPSNTYFTTNSYWAGTDKADSLVIDLGDTFTIDHASILFPWWGGNQRRNNRGYAFQFAYSTDLGDFDDIGSGNWTTVYTDTEARHVTTAGSPWIFHFNSGTNVGSNIYLGGSPISVRYFRVLITNTKAWYGSKYDDQEPDNDWQFQCDPDTNHTQTTDLGKVLEPVMKDKKINDREIEPANDCYASIVEFGAFEEFLEVSTITNLIKQRIKSDNKQIEYFHNADASETKSVGTSENMRKYEPGTFFNKADITYSSANNIHTKFFPKDCVNCYKEFNFGVIDNFNSLIYRSDNTSESNTIVKTSHAAKSITMKGSAGTAVVNSVDAWLGKLDALSWGGSYTFSEKIGDYLTLNFRGESFIWWATVPAAKTGATMLLKIRSRNDTTGAWSGWTTLDAGFSVPNDVSSEIIYEIPINTTLASNTSYQIYMENLDGGFVSVDSFGGWWVGSMVDYNEDSDRISVRWPDHWKQIYDSRFSAGSMFKTNKQRNSLWWGFNGDRLQIYSAKGRHHGDVTILMSHGDNNPREFDPSGDQRVFIPGGSGVDGSYTVSLGTGKKGHEVPGILILDSSKLTGWKFGSGGASMDALPWGYYSVLVKLVYPEKYMSDPTIEDADQFVKRCRDCNPEYNGTDEINKFIHFDGMSIHEYARISGSWKLQKNVDILASVAEALELEWDVGEAGLTVLPRIGIDTDIILKEGINTVLASEVIKDGAKLATQLISSGADIDGLPLFTVVENRKNRTAIGRTVQQIQDYRDISDYFTLVGISRTELVRRREPEYRVTVSHVGYKYGLKAGDSFIVKKNTQNPIRVRIDTLIINQSKSGGITYEMECSKWPPIV